LLKELDENEWFRHKVAEAWDGDEAAASALFLNRPGGWWLEISAMVDDAGAGREALQLAALQAKIASVEAKRLAAAGKAKEYRRAAQDAKRAAKDMVESAKQKTRKSFEVERAEASAISAELDETRSRFAALDEEHRELQDAFALLRSRFAKARRGRFAGSESGGSSSWVPSDPVKLARLLDLQTAEFGRHVAEPHQEQTPGTVPLLLPAGVRPDSSDAIRWLIGLPESVVVVVDGYNAQFHVDRADFTSGAARRRLVDALKRLRSATAAKHRVVVVYDSTMPGDREARTSLGGVEIRFAEEDRIADEEIVEMAANLDRAVVISSDRAVREGAEGNGAVVLWSEALGTWLARS
jgi:predicted RNA-binding protein with PIN domain